ncbi:MAG: immunoglobulin-like domain-containing protein, partial [Cellulosilyticaceae bacterium]
TDRVVVTGEVDSNTLGDYVLNYTVADSEGLTTTVLRKITVKEKEVLPVPESNFGVGQGIEWPQQVNAPFVDMCLWTGDQDYANNGVIDLAKISAETGLEFFNLGFIKALGGTQASGDKLNWAWGGFPTLNETSTDQWQYEGLKRSIKEVREAGGDVAISLGGLNGLALWEATEDVDILTNTYMELVTGYGLTRLDLDIEGGAQGKEKNRINAQAIKRVQDATGVEIVLTLPVMPDGLTYLGKGTVEAFLEAGVDVSVVNLMTMCYGASVPDYAVGSVQAVDSVMRQLKDMYRAVGVTLTDKEAYAKLGTTPSIGFETEAHPIFTVDQSRMVVEHATQKGLAMTSFWSLNRDSKLDSNTGVPSKYAFTEVFKTFGEEITPEINTKPELRGVADITISIGEVFDKMQGVTAYDQEDGDLTDAIVVEGEVDTNVAGSYNLIYTVVDSEGLEDRATRQVAVEPKVNKAPVIAGANNVTLTVGDSFDEMAGVTAHDEEDGDLTNAIVVVGEVDTNVAGIYDLTYTVVDSEGLEARATRQVTVEPKVNKAPVIAGANNVTLVEGDTFDEMAGVTAHDEEDGDLTNAIVVEGEVDADVAGIYDLTYTVADSEGLETTATRVITVKAKPDPNNTYDSNKQYNSGDKVMYNDKEYTAKWWTQGDIPGEADVWEVTVELNPDGSQEYIPGKAYVEGDEVHYNGKNYIAKWWTTSVPGSDESWRLASEEGNTSSQEYVPGKAYTGGETVVYEGETYTAKWWTTAIPGSDDSWERQ